MTDRTATGSAGRRGAWRRGAQGGFVQVLLLVLVMFGITTFGVVSFQSEIVEREAKAVKVTPAALSQARKAILDYAVNPPSPPFQFSGNVSIRPRYNVFNAHQIERYTDDLMVPFRPGQLPCPDNVGDFRVSQSPFAISEPAAQLVPDGLASFNDKNLDGVSDPSFVLCSSPTRTEPLITDSSFGRLPWREYNDYTSYIRGAGSGDIRNAAGDRLWYAASYNLLDIIRPLNNYKLTRVQDDWLSVDIVDHPHDVSAEPVTTTIDGLAAVVISPGLHEGQPEGYWTEYRSSLAERPDVFGGDDINPAFRLDPSNRDGDRRFTHNTGSADPTLDRAAYVHREEILEAFARQDADPHLDGISQALSDFYERNRHLPDPATFESSNSEYIVRRFGRPAKGVNRHLYDSRTALFFCLFDPPGPLNLRPNPTCNNPTPPSFPSGSSDTIQPDPARRGFYPPSDMEDLERLQGGRVQYEFAPAYTQGADNYSALVKSDVRAIGNLPSGDVPAVYIPRGLAGRVNVLAGMGSPIAGFEMPPVSELFHSEGMRVEPMSSGPVEWIAVIEPNTPLQLAAPVHTSPERPVNLASGTNTRIISTEVTAPMETVTYIIPGLGIPVDIDLPAVVTNVLSNISRNSPPDQSVTLYIDYCAPPGVLNAGPPPTCAGTTVPVLQYPRVIPFRVPFISNNLTVTTDMRGDDDYRSFHGDYNALFADLRPGHAGNLAELGYDIRLPAGTYIKSTAAVTIFGSERQVRIPILPAVPGTPGTPEMPDRDRMNWEVDTRHAFRIIPSEDATFTYGVTRDLGNIHVPGSPIADLAVPAMTPISSGSQGLLPTPPLPNQIPYLDIGFVASQYDPLPFDEALPIYGEFSALRGESGPRPFGRAIGTPQFIDRTQHEVLMITDPNGGYGYFPAEVTMHPIFNQNINDPRNLDPDENAPRELTSPARLRIPNDEIISTVLPYPISDGETVIQPSRLTVEGIVTMPHDTTFHYPAGSMIPLGEKRFSHGATGRVFGFYPNDRRLRPPSQLYGLQSNEQRTLTPLPGKSAVVHLPPGAVIGNVDVAANQILPDGSLQPSTEVHGRLTLVNGGVMTYSQLLHYEDGDFSMVPQTWGQAGFRIESMGMGIVDPNRYPEPVGESLYDLLLAYMTEQPDRDVLSTREYPPNSGMLYELCQLGTGEEVEAISPLPSGYTSAPAASTATPGYPATQVIVDPAGTGLHLCVRGTGNANVEPAGRPSHPTDVVPSGRVRFDLTNDAHHNGYHVYPYHNMVVPMSRRMAPFASYSTSELTIVDATDMATSMPVTLSLTVRSPSLDPGEVSFIDNPISRLDVRYQAVGDLTRLVTNNITLQPVPNRAALATADFSGYSFTDEMGVGVELDTGNTGIPETIDTAAVDLTMGVTLMTPGAYTVSIIATTITLDFAEGGFQMQANPGRMHLGSESAEITLGNFGAVTMDGGGMNVPVTVIVTLANSHVALNQFGNPENATPLVAPFRPGAALAYPTGAVVHDVSLTNVLVSVVRDTSVPTVFIDARMSEIALRLDPDSDIAAYGFGYQDASLSPSDTMPLGTSLPDSLHALFDFHTDALMYESTSHPGERLMIPKGSKAEFGMLSNPSLVADLDSFTTSMPYVATLGVYSADYAPGGRVFRGVGFSPLPVGEPRDGSRGEAVRFSRDQHSFTGPSRLTVAVATEVGLYNDMPSDSVFFDFIFRHGADMQAVTLSDFTGTFTDGFAIENPRLMIPAGRDIETGFHYVSVTIVVDNPERDWIVSGFAPDRDIVLIGDSVEWLHNNQVTDGPVAFFPRHQPQASYRLIFLDDELGNNPDLSFSFVANSDGYQVVNTIMGVNVNPRRTGTITKGQIFRLRSAKTFDSLSRPVQHPVLEVSWSRRDDDWQHTDFRPDDLVFAQNNPLFYAVAEECRSDMTGFDEEECASGEGEGLNALALPGAAVRLPEESPPLAGLVVHGFRGSWIVPPDIEVVTAARTLTLAGVQFTEGGEVRAMKRHDSEVNAIEPDPGVSNFGMPGQTIVIRPGPRGMQFLQEDPGLTGPYRLPEVKADDPTARGHLEPLTVVLGGYTLGNEALSSYRLTASMSGELHLGGGTELKVAEHEDADASGLAVSIVLGPGSTYEDSGGDTTDISDMSLVNAVTGFEVALGGDAVRTGPGLDLPEVVLGGTRTSLQYTYGQTPEFVCAARAGIFTYTPGSLPPGTFPCDPLDDDTTDFDESMPWRTSTITLVFNNFLTVATTHGAAGTQPPDTRFEVVTLAAGVVAKFDTPGYAWQGAIQAASSIGVQAESQIFEATQVEGEQWFLALRDHNFDTADLALDAVTIGGLTPVPNPTHSRTLPLNLAMPHNKGHEDAWLADYTGTDYALNNSDVTVTIPTGSDRYCFFCGVAFTLTLPDRQGGNGLPSIFDDVAIEITLTNVASEFQIREGSNIWSNLPGLFDSNITVQIAGSDLAGLDRSGGPGSVSEIEVQVIRDRYMRGEATPVMLPPVASTDGFSGHVSRSFFDGSSMPLSFSATDHTPPQTRPSHTAFRIVEDYARAALNSEALFDLPSLTGFTLQRFGNQVTTLTIGEHMDLFAPVAFYKQPGIGVWQTTMSVSLDIEPPPPILGLLPGTPNPRNMWESQILPTDTSQLYIERRQLPIGDQQSIATDRAFYPELTEGITDLTDLDRNPIFNEIEVEFLQADPALSGRNLWFQVPTPAVTIGAEVLPGGSVIYPERGLALPARRLVQASGPEIVLTLGANGAVANVVAGGGGGSPGIYTRPSAITTSVEIEIATPTAPYTNPQSLTRIRYRVEGPIGGARTVDDVQGTPGVGYYRLLSLRFAIPDVLLPSGSNFTSAALDNRGMDSVFRREDVEAADPGAFDPSNFAADPQYEFAPHMHRIVFPAMAEITLHRYFAPGAPEEAAQRSVTLVAGTTLDPHEPIAGDAGSRPAAAYDVGGMVIDRIIDPAVTTTFADLNDTARAQILGFNDDLTALENPIYQNMWVRVRDDVDLVVDGVTISIPENSVINPLLGTYLPSAEVDIQNFSDRIRLNARSSVSLYANTQIEFAPPAAKLPEGITIHVGGRPVRFSNIKALIGHSPEPLIEFAICASADEVIEFSQKRELVSRRNLLDATYRFAGPLAADFLELANAPPGGATPWGTAGPVDPAGVQVGDAHKCMLLDDPENTDQDDWFLFGNIHRATGINPRAGIAGNDVFRMVGGRMVRQ